MVVARLRCCNCEHSGWLLLLWAVISAERSDSAPCFDKEKIECFNSFERFTISVAQVVNHGEKFDDSDYASMWKW